MNSQQDLTMPKLSQEAAELDRLMQQRGIICGTGRDARQDVAEVPLELTESGRELLRRLSA